MDGPEFCIRAQLDDATLENWIGAGWLLPKQGTADFAFSEIDIARSNLIRDLRNDLGVNDEGVTVILDLLDQIHGARQMFRVLLSSVQRLPDSTRHQILADIRSARDRK
jgi:chaperone modulatory protein CbpM